MGFILGKKKCYSKSYVIKTYAIHTLQKTILGQNKKQKQKKPNPYKGLKLKAKLFYLITGYKKMGNCRTNSMFSDGIISNCFINKILNQVY